MTDTRKRNIRILLINNPTASLFMAAWFVQNDYHKDSTWRNVAIVTTVDYDQAFSENIEQKKRAWVKASSSIFKDLVNEWYVCSPPKVEEFLSVIIKPYEIVKRRRYRKTNIDRISNLLHDNNIDPEDVVEIWSPCDTYLPLFNLICNKATIITFEHGLSDLRGAAIYRNAAIYEAFGNLYSAVRSVVKKLDRLLTFYSMYDNKDKHVSIFGKELVLANPHLPTASVRPDAVSSLLHSIMRDDPGYAYFTKLDGNSAIILLESVKDYTDDRREYLRFFRSFEEYLLKHCSDLLLKNEIKYIIFKSRFFFEESTKEALVNFGGLNKLFNVILLNDVSPSNYAVEYYIPIIRPRVLMGAFSSGLFYSKKIGPGLTTLSYDNWYLDYCKERFGRTHPDFVWLRPFFESDKMAAFRPFLPQDIEYD